MKHQAAPNNNQNPRKLRVLFLAAEAAPLVKVGGLGDVAGSLPAALKDLPHPVDVQMALPFYNQLDLDRKELKPAASFTVAHRSGPLLAEVFQSILNGVRLYLISGPPVAAAGAVYSGNSHLDGAQFTFFSLAAMQLARSLKWQPDILHAHDWHASPAVYNLSLIRGSDDFFKDTKSLLTVHNMPYLGHGSGAELGSFGLPSAEGSPLPSWAQHLPLPLGLLTADAINTVSKGYAREILTPEYGSGLENFLLSRADDIQGILNGLDTDSWDPETDPHLPVNYSITSLERRRENKLTLLNELNLDPDPERPLLAMINRMDYQKGVDLVPDTLRTLMDPAWQAVILGTGDPRLEAAAADLDRETPRVRTVLRYDGALARRIYAGADLMIIPSRYEPCGLTQMISMRYGCVPAARATGGLRDTIGDYHADPREESTGFLFEAPSSEALADTLRRALQIYQDQRRWKGLQRRGMKQDFSWARSAEEYLEVYESLMR